jgi:hypothetical protein
MLNKEKLKNTKFYIGPMSKNIVDTILDFSINEKTNVGIIPTRRQIDYNGGYVNDWTTDNFFKYVENKKNDHIIFERDHGGINQGVYQDNGTSSLYTDAKLFDIIHIDPWRYYNSPSYRFDALKETANNIKYINKLNPNCFFEIGTEESIYKFDEIKLKQMLIYLKNDLGNELFDKIIYCVIQSGTKLEGTKNIGNFNINRLKKMLNVCDEYNILSKEHNGDYLTPEQLKLRFDVGLSAINIAPEFGVYETDILLEYMNNEQIEKFFKICYLSNKWEKWVNEKFNPMKDKIELIRICGHYNFSNPEFINMNINIDDIIKQRLYEKLKKLNKIL